MVPADSQLLETILRHCQSAAPAPWYPRLHAEQHGIDRDSLDAPLEALRLGGWIQLTEWIAGKGQGYQLTDQGRELLADPRALARWRGGQLLAPAAPPARPVQRGEAGTSAWDRGEAVREAFLHPVTPVITFTLMAACVVLYAAERLAPAGGALARALHAGQVVFGPLLIQGEWWRLLSYGFFHANVNHLLMNLLGLFVLGREGERLWGRWRFIALYLISDLGGGVAALLLSDARTLGASGAVCGLFAALAVWLFRNQTVLPPELTAGWKFSMLLNVILITLISLAPGVSWQCHLGGAVAGAAAAFLLDWQRFGGGRERLAAWLGLLCLPVLGVGLLLVQQQRAPQWQAWSSFVAGKEQVDQALRVYRDLVEPALGPDPAAVPKAQEAIAQLQARAAALRKSLEQCAPSDDPEVQRVRGNAELLLTSVLRFCLEAGAALERGGPLGPALAGQVRQLERLQGSARRELTSDF